MRGATCWRLALLWGAALACEVEGQLIRGTVRETSSASPLAGVVVSIHPVRHGSGDQAVTLAATLTDAQGGYALAAGGATTVVLTAKRIGARMYHSPPLSLAAGETRVLDVSLEALTFELPVVTISGATPCRGSARDQARIASLWEEARTALRASELSLRERRFRVTLTRYERTLDPQSLAVRREARSVQRSVTESPFVSIPAESLAAHGYARLLPDRNVEYFAPDERVLLSDIFVRDHCFGLAREAVAGLVGITFEPVRNRAATDIAGTLWLDSASFELRRIAFRYTNFPMPVQDPRSGGEVHFARLATGAWHVSRWFMRAPRVELHRENLGTGRAGRVVTDTPRLTGFTEVGGSATADRAGGGARLATLSGRVVDSTGQAALPRARVSITGLARDAPVRADGSFRLAQLPAGTYTLVATHPDYSRLGLLAAEQDLTVDEGSNSVTLLQALGTTQILRQLCGYDMVPDTVAVMRLTFPAPPVAASAAERVAALRWSTPRMVGPDLVRTVARQLDLPVDGVGGVTACGLPLDARLEIEESFAGRAPPRRFEARTPAASGLLVVELRD